MTYKPFEKSQPQPRSKQLLHAIGNFLQYHSPGKYLGYVVFGIFSVILWLISILYEEFFGGKPQNIAKFVGGIILLIFCIIGLNTPRH